MHSIFRIGATALSLTAATLGAAQAATLYESATFVDESQSNGSYFIDSSRVLGAVFHVGSSVQLTAIGGNFSQYGGDGQDVFGAVLALASGASLPGDVAATAVAHANFTPVGGDQSVALSANLAVGDYAVVFGSGLFGATGYSALVDNQNPVGTPHLIQISGGSASDFTDATLRVTVSAVPEPASAALLLAGLAAMGGLGVSRRSR